MDECADSAMQADRDAIACLSSTREQQCSRGWASAIASQGEKSVCALLNEYKCCVADIVADRSLEKSGRRRRHRRAPVSLVLRCVGRANSITRILVLLQISKGPCCLAALAAQQSSRLLGYRWTFMRGRREPSRQGEYVQQLSRHGTSLTHWSVSGPGCF